MTQQEAKGKGKKEVTFTMKGAKLFGYGLVLLGLMVWVFALGVLTGRGDMNRLFQRLGLYKTDLASRIGLAPDGQTVAVLTPFLPGEAQPAAGEAPKKSAPETTVAQAATALAPPAAKTADPVSAKAAGESAKKAGAAADAKKAKGPPAAKTDPETTLASKLSFLNSLDSPARKPPKVATKKEGSVHTASIASVPAAPKTDDAAASPETKKPAPAYQIRVASFRTAEEADKALADLRKKGFKVNVQQGKDKSGTTYTIRTGRYTSKAEAEKVTQKLKEAKVTAQIQEVKP